MELETIFARFNPWWNEAFTSPGILREKYLLLLNKELNEKQVTFVMGLRRVGKTTLLKQVIAMLLKQGVPAKNILFLSLDHSGLATYSLLSLVEKYRELQAISVKEKIYLFLDEVQYFNVFEQDIKIIHDHENAKIIASGSNSLLIKDKKAFLTGRNKVLLINPLSFEEYLLFRNISVDKSESQLLKHYFSDYLVTGGIPEYILTNDPEKITNLVSNIIYKDIIGKHNIKNAKKIEELFLLLCERVGKNLTYNKLAKILDLDVETVSSYISYFEETFLIYQIQRYTKSYNEALRSPKKIYICDNGIKTTFVGNKDKGALWENFVFLTIKQRKVNYFYQDDHEIDFIIQLKNKRLIAVEAKYKDILSEKDKQAFGTIPFKEKILVKDIDDLKKLNKILSDENK
ncbi:ATP-binding protein [Candidatus Woesearchaeota archaeon]|nr:ATP-binding protein [Candidatus Woesearchaeota archaeon]